MNTHGFREEGEAFFAWLMENGFLSKNLYLVCGDKHWQYHSVHPSGFEEFSVGALVDGNSRLGPKPGDAIPRASSPSSTARTSHLAVS
jgi:alkaline phosphatase D